MRFDELAVFVKVAESGSLTAAANSLGVPKSTVSRAVRRLEESLGAVLVRRAASGPTLTEAGQELVTYAAPHVAALQDAASAVSRRVGEAHGHLKITAPGDIAQVALAPLVSSFLARHPKVSVEIEAGMRVVDLVGEGFDLAIRVAQLRLAPSALVARKLCRLDAGLYASPAYLAREGTPKRPADLDQHEFVLLRGGGDGRSINLEGQKERVKLKVRGRAMSNDFFFAREAAIANAGIAPMPWFVASREVARGRLVHLLPDYQMSGMTAYIVHQPLRPLPRKVEVFRSHLLEHAPRLLSANSYSD